MKTILKNLLRLSALAMILIITAHVTYAQPGGQQGPPKLPNDKQIEKMISNLSDELSLTKTQTDKVSELYKAHFKEVSDVMGDSQNSKPDRKVMEQMKEDFENDVEAVLTEDQQKLYIKFLKKQESNRGRQGNQGKRE